jgi:hypothetical protein
VTFRRTVSEDDPLRVGFIGDSVGFSLIGTLSTTATELQERRNLPFTTVSGFQGPGFGLTADVQGYNDVGPAPPPEAYAGWRDSVRRMITDEDPDLVLVLLGVWDTIQRAPGGRRLTPGTSDWNWWYGLLASEFVTTLTSRGATVIWMTMPCTGRADLNERLGHVNRVLRGTWRVAPERVGFVDLDEVACRNGRPVYRAKGPWGPFTVREADGIHFRPMEAPAVLRPFLVRRFTSLLRDLIVTPGKSRVI